MPRRGRPKKTGGRREDAAIDAMKLYGFEERLINKALKELLDVYGEDGWIFIEEASYKVLLEALLDRNDKDDEDKTEECSFGGSELASSSTPITTSTTAIAIGAAADEAEQAVTDAVLPALTDSTSQTDENANPIAINFETGSNKLEIKKASSAVLGYTEAATPSSAQNFVEPRFPADNIVATRRRKPCYGWIEDDDDHDAEDTVELTPELLSEELQKLLHREVNGEKKRKRRWDLKPKDLATKI